MKLTPSELRLTIDPLSLGFSDTSELVREPLTWIGQERAEKAARFGLSVKAKDYNLFVLGEVGSGRSSLMQSLMNDAAQSRPIPPDICYIYNFDAPESPVLLKAKAGKGKEVKEALLELLKKLQKEIPRLLEGQAFKLEEDRIVKRYKEKEFIAYQSLSRFAEERRFALKREEGRLLFTILGEKGQVLPEEKILALPLEKKAQLDRDEDRLRDEIQKFLESMRPHEKQMKEETEELRICTVKPLIEREIRKLREAFSSAMIDAEKFLGYLDRLTGELIGNSFEEKEEDWFVRFKINVLVDNSALPHAPAIVENNPQFHSLFGSVEYHVANDVLVTDFTCLKAGSLFKANGGYLMLHLVDLLPDPGVWEKLRRFLRSGMVRIEEPTASSSSIAAVSLEPEMVALDVKIVLIGSREHYYDLEEADPEFMRHFRVKVDFAESVAGNEQTRRAASVLIGSLCRENGLPHFSCAAAAKLMEDAHRLRDDQYLQSTRFSRLETLVVESAAFCLERGGETVSPEDVDAALSARKWRHSYPEEQLHGMIEREETLIEVEGKKVAQLNGLSRIEFGDHLFGGPLRISACTYPGREGLLNIEREVSLSGPIHDKGVFILESYLARLFFHVSPLSLNASLVFEQEYAGVEGDSASLAEWCALMSSLSGVPLLQGIAVTGAINMQGEVMPVGGVNEKIEGFFRTCLAKGLSGSQGVIIPSRNKRHLMLENDVIEAVEKGRFHIHAVSEAGEALEILSGMACGTLDSSGRYPESTMFGLAQESLLRYGKAYMKSRGRTE